MAHRPKLKKDPFKKEKAFPLRKKSLFTFGRRYLANMIAFLALAGFFVGGYFYLNYRNQQKPESDPTEVRIKPDSFEDILRNGSVARLINEYNLIEADPGTQLPVVIDGYRKRLKLANRLLEFKDDHQAVNFGTIAKIKALSRWDLLNVGNDIDDPDVRKQLVEMTRANLENENPDVRNTAQMCDTVMALYDYAKSPADHDFQAAKDKINEFVGLAANDMEAASVLYRCAELLDLNNFKKESSAIFELLSDAFGASEIEAIRQMAVTARKSFVAVEYGLNEIPDDLDVDRQGTLAVVRDKITTILEKGDLQAEEVETVIRLIELLMGRNEIEEVRVQLPKLSEPVAALQRDPNNVKEKYKAMVTEAAAYGKPLDFSGLRTPTDQPIDTASMVKSIRLVVYWSPENPGSFRRLTGLTRKDQIFNQHSIELMVIYLDSGSAPANLEFKTLADQFEDVKFYRAPLNENEGKAFMSRFPITGKPFLILLDEENNIRSINPPPFLVKSELEKLVFGSEKGKN